NYSEKKDLRLSSRRQAPSAVELGRCSPKVRPGTKPKDRVNHGSFPIVLRTTFVTGGNHSVIDRPRMALLRLGAPLLPWSGGSPISSADSVVGTKMVDPLRLAALALRTSTEK